jgi:L-lactate dehydrogenase complex protein LldF
MWSSSTGTKGGRYLLKGRRRLATEVRRSIEEPERVGKLWEAMERGRANRAATIEKTGLDLPAFRDRVRSIKETAAQDPTIAEDFAEAVRTNGGRVFFAATGPEAVQYLLDVCRANGAEFLVKSKSLTSEEIELNQGLAAEGIRAIETDLGELLCQVAGEKPSHLVFPAIHMTSDRIARMLTEAYGETIAPEPSSILSAVRARLRPQFLEAKVGVTGANIGVAETGSIVVETNEGNGRLVTSVPRVHVAIIGLEKIVRRWEDAADLVRGHAISATGQRMTVYVSMLSRRLPVGGDPADREFHVVILDNGRTRMRADPSFRDALNCIRCGACMNVCPTYGVTGGHVFGHIYPGPIGIPWTANVHGLEEASFAHLCVSCGLCHEICPVDIDIPWMIAKVKEQDVEVHGQPTAERFFMASEAFAKVACLAAPLANGFLQRSAVRILMEWTLGVDRRRTLPAFTRRTLRSRFRKRGASPGRAGHVAFFPDLYAEYNNPDLGLRAIEILERLGYSVIIPDVQWSGMPYVSYGRLAKASKLAAENLRVLGPLVDEGYEIVSTEPTAVYMLRKVYPKLVEGDLTSKVAGRSHGFFEFIQPRLANLALRPAVDATGFVGFHISCHDRALSSGVPAMRFLERASYRVRPVETGTCCGIAGTFGMKSGWLGYELSMAVGEKLFDQFRGSGCEIIATESSVCTLQLQDGLGRPVRHPLDLVRLEGPT